MEHSESIDQLNAAIVVAQGLIQNPSKSAVNPQFNSKYADLATVLDVVRPAFTEAGIGIIQTPSRDETGAVVVTTMLVHASGQWMRDKIHMHLADSAKNPAQAAGSLITYLRRYSLAAFANVAQTDDDGQALEGQTAVAAPKKSIDPEQVELISAELESCSDKATAEFLELKKLRTLEDIPKDKFPIWLEQVKKRKEKEATSEQAH